MRGLGGGGGLESAPLMVMVVVVAVVVRSDARARGKEGTSPWERENGKSRKITTRHDDAKHEGEGATALV